MLFFVLRDIILTAFIWFIPKKSNLRGIKNILFVEPLKQGYGDIFFQTGLFENWKRDGYRVSILTTRGHAQILENNPNIDSIHIWSFRSRFQFIRGNCILVGLGRDTLRETLLMLFSLRAAVIVFDRDLKAWRDIFGKFGNTLAWQKLSEHYLGTKFYEYEPKIFFSTNEKELIYSKRKHKRIGVIAGVEDTSKSFEKTESLVHKINKRRNAVALLGKGNGAIRVSPKVINFVNRLSYRETLIELASCHTAVGAEGSLIQIASSLLKRVFVIDFEGRFEENSHPNFLKNVKLFRSQSSENAIKNILNEL
ncbi:MAG: hypothetical protein HYU81_01175 [Candidatus Brennerbacteria bacterium]|nr:hypothetical protein [Candidatus Brennerbacteria bacterium]